MKQSNNLKILLIEDNKMFRDLAFEVFEGCDRITASDAEEGLEKFKVNLPDITLLDIGLPDKSGLELLPILLEHDPDAFIVMLTASNVENDVQTATKLGASGYIIKPFSLKSVEDCIAQYHIHRKTLTNRSAPTATNAKDIAEIPANPEPDPKNSKEWNSSILADELKKWHILFVDDHEINRQHAKEHLNKLGCKVDVSESGEEALEKIKKNNYNLIFMDTRMYVIDGYEATRRIRKDSSNANCYVVGMIESIYEIKQQLWKLAGMDDYIFKPAKLTHFNKVIFKYVEQSYMLENKKTVKTP